MNPQQVIFVCAHWLWQVQGTAAGFMQRLGKPYPLYVTKCYVWFPIQWVFPSAGVNLDEGRCLKELGAELALQILSVSLGKGKYPGRVSDCDGLSLAGCQTGHSSTHPTAKTCPHKPSPQTHRLCLFPFAKTRAKQSKKPREIKPPGNTSKKPTSLFGLGMTHFKRQPFK